MTLTARIGTWIATAVLAALPLGGARADAPTYAGTVADVTPDGRSMTLEVLGPWHGPGTTPSRHRIAVPPGTPVILFERAEVGESGWRGGFAEKPLRPADLRPGDYATVKTHREDGRLIAERVEIVRP
jgi:hypothetical protein